MRAKCLEQSFNQTWRVVRNSDDWDIRNVHRYALIHQRLTIKPSLEK